MKFITEVLGAFLGTSELETALRQENLQLRQLNNDLRKQNDKLRTQANELQQKRWELQEQNQQLAEANRALSQQIAALELAAQQQNDNTSSDAEVTAASEKAQILAMPFDEVLDLRARTRNILVRNGFETVGDICACTAIQIYLLRDCGKSTLNDLALQLGYVGLKLAEPEDASDRAWERKILWQTHRQLITVEKLDLSVRTYNEVTKAGFKSAADVRYEAYVHEKIPDKKAADEFIEKLKAFGVL